MFSTKQIRNLKKNNLFLGQPELFPSLERNFFVILVKILAFLKLSFLLYKHLKIMVRKYENKTISKVFLMKPFKMKSLVNEKKNLKK